jgi:hypothetical protein
MLWLKTILWDIPLWIFQESCIMAFQSIGWEVDYIDENLFFILGVLIYLFIIVNLCYNSGIIK